MQCITRRVIATFAIAASSTAAVAGPVAAQSVPAPAEHFGFEIGSDRNLADWVALTAYFERLAETSDRVAVDTLGMTTDDRPSRAIAFTRTRSRVAVIQIFPLAGT